MNIWRARWLGVPAVVWVGLVMWLTLLVVVILVCNCADTTATKCLEVFTDAFKVGLGAFIAMLAQWSNKVFGDTPPAESASGASSPQSIRAVEK